MTSRHENVGRMGSSGFSMPSYFSTRVFFQRTSLPFWRKDEGRKDGGGLPGKFLSGKQTMYHYTKWYAYIQYTHFLLDRLISGVFLEQMKPYSRTESPDEFPQEIKSPVHKVLTGKSSRWLSNYYLSMTFMVPTASFLHGWVGWQVIRQMKVSFYQIIYLLISIYQVSAVCSEVCYIETNGTGRAPNLVVLR